MAVTLLNGSGDFHLGFLLKLPDFALLVVRQLGYTLRFDQFTKRETPNDFFPHFVDPGFIGNDEHKMIAQAPQTNAITAFALENSGDQFWNSIHCRTNGGAVIRHDRKARATIS